METKDLIAGLAARAEQLSTPPPARLTSFVSRLLAREVERVHDMERHLGLAQTPASEFRTLPDAKRRHKELRQVLEDAQSAGVFDPSAPSSHPAAVVPPAALPPVATPPASVAVPKPANVPPSKPDFSHLKGLERATAAHKLASGKPQHQKASKPDFSHLKGLERALAVHAQSTPPTEASADLPTMRKACQAVLGFAPRSEAPAADQRAEILRAFANAGVEYPGAKIHQIERTGTGRIMQSRHQDALNKFLSANQTN